MHIRTSVGRPSLPTPIDLDGQAAMHAPQPTQRSASITAEAVLWNQILSSSSGTPFASMMSSRTSRAGSACGGGGPAAKRSAVSTMSVPFLEVAADAGRCEVVEGEVARAHRAEHLGDGVEGLVHGLLEAHPLPEARGAEVAAE